MILYCVKLGSKSNECVLIGDVKGHTETTRKAV